MNEFFNMFLIYFNYCRLWGRGGGVESVNLLIIVFSIVFFVLCKYVMFYLEFFIYGLSLVIIGVVFFD